MQDQDDVFFHSPGLFLRNEVTDALHPSQAYGVASKFLYDALRTVIVGGITGEHPVCYFALFLIFFSLELQHKM